VVIPTRMVGWGYAMNWLSGERRPSAAERLLLALEGKKREKWGNFPPEKKISAHHAPSSKVSGIDIGVDVNRVRFIHQRKASGVFL